MSMSDTPTTILDEPVILGSSEGTGEVQKVDLTSLTAAKEWTLSFAGETTKKLAAKASVTAANVQAALLALSNIPDDGLTVTGATGGPFTVTFAADAFEEDNVPQLTATGDEGTVAVTTVSQGESPAEAVIRGTGDADRTGDVSPLTGESPAENRVANKATYGDA